MISEYPPDMRYKPELQRRKSKNHWDMRHKEWRQGPAEFDQRDKPEEKLGKNKNITWKSHIV